VEVLRSGEMPILFVSRSLGASVVRIGFRRYIENSYYIPLKIHKLYSLIFPYHRRIFLLLQTCLTIGELKFINQTMILCPVIAIWNHARTLAKAVIDRDD